MTFLWLVCLLPVATAASAAPLYNIVSLGPDDLEHTRNDGYKYSQASQLNEAGQVSGNSYRYNGGSTDLGQSVWLYDGATTIDVGHTGAEYTRNDGYKYSRADQLNEAGQVIGFSIRYNGGNTYLGWSAWLYDGATTIDVGLTGAEHTRNDGFKLSDPDQLNEAGQVSGGSQRYNGGTYLGLSWWLYDGATTINVGLTGAEHTRNDGFKYSQASQLNEAGQLTGVSYRYNGGSSDMGYSAWLYDGANTIAIGLTGSEHTRNDGYKQSEGRLQLNEAGQVSGVSYRYNGGSTYLGASAWLYDGATTIDVGLTGAEHTRNDGYKYSGFNQLNEAGQVSGYSYRFNGSTDLGQSVWLYDGANTIDVGLTGSEHTRNDGYKYSGAGLLNEAGQVSGYSYRFSGGTYLGQGAWLYDGANTFAIGLTDTEHTRNDGYRASGAGLLNEAGQVAGYSQRYNGGSTILGASAWLYDGANTFAIGLTDTEHTRNDGYRASGAGLLNEAGQVAGYSQRYNGGSTQLGQDAWLYDPVLDQSFALQLSTRSDGYAFSSAEYLGDDGLVLGTYTLFSALDNNLGNRAFFFTIAGGLHDSGSLVDGGLAANGWESLASAIRANGLGQIFGHGKLTSQSGGQMAYLLTPAVPEPSSLLLLCFGGLAVLWRRRGLLCAAILAAGVGAATSAQAVTFGSGANTFDIQFVSIGNPGNAADDISANPDFAGSVPYTYRIGKFEISEQMIDKANALGGLGITKDTRGADKPATSTTWNEAARFVNWLNTSTGSTPAYKFAIQPGEVGYSANANIQLWTISDAGYNPNNLFRNNLARYFLPSVDEWYKAAYYDPTSGVYYDYPTGSDSVPDGIDFVGDPDFDAVFIQGGLNSQPDDITNVGALSPYDTAGQGGNVYEWEETESDLVNDSPLFARGLRGGSWGENAINLLSSVRNGVGTSAVGSNIGFRVASNAVPEPSTLQLLCFGSLAALWRRRGLVCASILAAVVGATVADHADAITIDTVPVGNVGNANDPATGNLYGGVSYAFRISTTEVTVGQYTEFLNAVAATDNYGLYNSFMATDLNVAGIVQSGVSGSYSYSTIGSANRPIAYVSWGDAARFCNWLNNGQPTGGQVAGTTEDGAYFLNGATSNVALSAITRKVGAHWFIPTENEWYKAAYHKNDGPTSNFWSYPNGTDNEPNSDQPPGALAIQSNVGNFNRDDGLANGYNDGYAVTGSTNYSGFQNYLTDVGAYSSAPSPYGTFDQGGNVYEWNESFFSNSQRVLRGGSWLNNSSRLQSSNRINDGPIGDDDRFGFRVASIPEPSSLLLLCFGSLAVLWRRRGILCAAILAAAVGTTFADHAQAVTIDMVPVGNPGNAGELSGTGAGGYGPDAIVGAVAYNYRIGTTEVTNSQYAEFLNAKAASDPFGLYNTFMGDSLNYGGITQSGSSGSYTYATIAGRGDMPVNWVSWYDSIRFANWLRNGQGKGDTETGAYTLGALNPDGTPVNGDSITRNAGATWFLPSEDEWYKAAYHKNDGVTGNYFDYPTSSVTAPAGETPPGSSNSANYSFPVGDLTNGGAYTGTKSPYGAFDMDGNVWERNEALFDGSSRGLRSSSFDDFDSNNQRSWSRNSDPATRENFSIGFRVASIPELPGDYNGNGVVDAADYVVWRKTDGTQSGYDVWRAHFGQTAGSGTGVSANATVPEPTTAVMLLFAAAVPCLLRRRAL